MTGATHDRRQLISLSIRFDGESCTSRQSTIGVCCDLMGTRLYIGCGLHPVDGWENIDKSFGPFLSRHPRLRGCLKALKILSAWQVETDWPTEVRRVDVTRHFPWRDDSVDAIFCDRMLGFLSRDQAVVFLEDCLRALRPGGRMRLVVFDLHHMVRIYSESKRVGNGDAADRLTKRLALERESDSRGPLPYQAAKRLLPGLEHNSNRSLYDFESLSRLLASVGFAHIAKGELRAGDFPDVARLEDRMGSGEAASVFVIQANRPLPVVATAAIAAAQRQPAMAGAKRHQARFEFTRPQCQGTASPAVQTSRSMSNKRAAISNRS